MIISVQICCTTLFCASGLVSMYRCVVRRFVYASLSATDKLSWDAKVDSIPEGFKIFQSEIGTGFYCASCNVPVDP